MNAPSSQPEPQKTVAEIIVGAASGGNADAIYNREMQSTRVDRQGNPLRENTGDQAKEAEQTADSADSDATNAVHDGMKPLDDNFQTARTRGRVLLDIAERANKNDKLSSDARESLTIKLQEIFGDGFDLDDADSSSSETLVQDAINGKGGDFSKLILPGEFNKFVNQLNAYIPADAKDDLYRGNWMVADALDHKDRAPAKPAEPAPVQPMVAQKETGSTGKTL